MAAALLTSQLKNPLICGNSAAVHVTVTGDSHAVCIVYEIGCILTLRRATEKYNHFLERVLNKEGCGAGLN